jgi:hypothetical protein
LATGSANLTVRYTGRTCGTTTGGCPAVAAVATTLWVWQWPANAWVQLGAPASVGPADTTITRQLPAPQADFIGTGGSLGQLRLRVQAVGGTTNFTTQANQILLTYDAP